jgi:hypothetical protein
MSQQTAFCDVCDHKIVTGIACDGQPKECPYHAVHGTKHRQIDNFAMAVDSLTGKSDPDAVRSID